MKVVTPFLVAFSLLLASVSFGVTETMNKKQSNIPAKIYLWNGGAPGAQGTAPDDQPNLTTYLPTGKSNGAAFIVCPGGGYMALAEHEGGPPAQWFNSLGVTAFVLQYRIGPKYHYPTQMEDVMRAIRLVRAHASEWGIDPNRIGIMGFSAGGHLAATAATCFDGGDPNSKDSIDHESSRPDAAALIYPVITMTRPYTHEGSRDTLIGLHPTKKMVDSMSMEKRVTDQTPPSFLVSTSEDTVVPMENTLMFAEACHAHHVPVEIHIYGHGAHGFGLASNDPELSTWTHSCELWLRHLGFLKNS